MSTTTAAKPPRWNIGSLTRWGLKQLLGTDKGNQIITLIEDDVPTIWAALKRGDYAAFIDALPVEHLAGIVGVLTKRGVLKL